VYALNSEQISKVLNYMMNIAKVERELKEAFLKDCPEAALIKQHTSEAVIFTQQTSPKEPKID
jgi:hypothetical protein